jgi:hypothetical protein
MRSNAYARATMFTRGLITRRLQRCLPGIARCRSRSLPGDRGAQVVRELSGRDSLLLNVLADSAEHRRSDSADDFARVLAADPGNVADSLRHGVVMLAEDLRKRDGLLWIFRVRGGFTMDGVRATRVRMRRHCRSYQGNCGIHRPLRNEGIDAKPLAHLLDSRAAHLLLNLFLY